jgi:tetratricopeptide (TPR) repeat protein
VIAPPAAGAAGRPVPAQLPADAEGFTGRGAELAELSRLLDADRPGGGSRLRAGRTALAICVVSGSAGVGKTALAVRWAHRSRGRFPDGQLYVDLRGYDPDQPVTAASALVGFLTALGVAGQDIPLDLDDRAARFRTEIADRRILVVLDNASSVEQVRRLLPGTRSAVVLVTSRDSLPGLVAVHGAHRIEVDLLPAADAITLLGRLIGPRVDAEPQAAAALAAQCARLPLAVRVAAELAVSRPVTSLADLVGELSDEQRRLELLDAGGDPRAAVRAVFSWSLRYLPTDAVRLFRLLGLHPGADFDPYAAAALTGTALAEVRRTLDALVRAHLVQPTGGGRYGMHDLLRAYAGHLAARHDTDERLPEIRTRLFDYYLAAAAAAMDTWNPAETSSRPRVAPPATPVPTFAAGPQALAWLDAERGVLGAVCAYTAAHGWPAHAVALAATLFRYLEAGGHHVDALAVHGCARDAARQAGDPSGQAVALIHLGTAYWRQGRYEPAAEYLQQALELARQTGDRPEQARALANLANVHGSQGRYELAGQRHQQALELARQTGDQIGQARALSNLGHIYVRQGRLDQAAEHHLQALDVFRRAGDRDGEAYALTGLGDACVRQGRLDQAAEHHLQALDLFRQAGDRGSEAEPLNGLGETALAAGHREQAIDLHLAALAVATDTGDRYQLARAHDGLGRTHHAAGNATQAGDHWRLALTLYTDLAAPEADAVRAGLDALAGTAGGAEPRGAEPGRAEPGRG